MKQVVQKNVKEDVKYDEKYDVKKAVTYYVQQDMNQEGNFSVRQSHHGGTRGGPKGLVHPPQKNPVDRSPRIRRRGAIFWWFFAILHVFRKSGGTIYPWAPPTEKAGLDRSPPTE